MNAVEFINTWLEFMSKDFWHVTNATGKGSWEDAWHERESRSWTHRVLGPAHSHSDMSPLGNFLVGRLGKEWRYRTEEWKVDLVLSNKVNWPDLEDRPQLFWPHTYEVIVEHESSCGISYEEMTKLILLRARLKVLITYTHPKEHRGSVDLIDRTQQQFGRMLEEAWFSLPEHDLVEYLLIVGQLEGSGEHAMIHWHTTSFSPTGTIINTSVHDSRPQ